MQETDFQLHVGDCVLGMSQLQEKSVDLVVTSPPYNLGIKYSKYEDARQWDEYWRWSLLWAAQVKRVLKEDGSFFLNVGASPSAPLLPYEFVVRLKELFTLQNTFHWIKSITVQTRAGDLISAGHFKPINSRRFVNDCHEFVFHLTKSGTTPLHRLGLGVPYTDKSNIARWGHTNGQDLRCRGNTWFIPYKTILSRSQERPHPATFPVELAANCIRIHGEPAKRVMLDPFLGIGHSAIAAKDCGVRQFIGFEIDGEYVEVARRAVQTGSTATMPSPACRRRGRPRKQTAPDEPSLF